MSRDVLAVNGICKNYADFSLKNVISIARGDCVVGFIY